MWSDRQEEQARASLRTLLADMRQQFHSAFDDLLVVERERIALGPAVRTDLTDPTLARPAGELFEGLDHIDPELDEWLRVEREKWRNARPASTAPQAQRRAAHGKVRSWRLPALLLLLAAGLSALLYFRPWAEPQPVIAVLKFKDLTGKNALLAAGLAEQLRVQLAQNPNVGVIGSQSSESQTIDGKDIPAAVRLLGASHALEGRVFMRDGETRLSFRLFEADRPQPIWSTYVKANVSSIVAGHGNIADHVIDLVGQVAKTQRNRRGLTADSRTWSDYFRAFELIMRGDPQSLQRARPILFEAIARYPEFAPALSILSYTSIRLSDIPLLGFGLVPQAEARREARAFALRAIAAAPDYGPSQTALGDSYYGLPGGLPAYRRAVELMPGSVKAHADLAYALELAGDWKQSLIHRRKAAQLEPLSFLTQLHLARGLAATDRFEDARRAIRTYVARDVPRRARFDMIAVSEVEIFGDWSNSYVAALGGLEGAPPHDRASQPAMWSSLLLFGPAAALPYADPGSMTALLLQGDPAKVAAKATELGVEFWGLGYETTAAVHFLLQHGKQDVLLAAYDLGRRLGLPAEALNFPEVAVALRAAGRSEEASAILKSFGTEVAQMQGLGPRRHALYWAMHRALQGRRDEAIRQLRSAKDGSWWAVSEVIDHPYNLAAFRPLRGDRRFQAMVNDYDQWVAKERREATVQAKAAGLPPPPSSPPPRFM